MQAVPFCIDTFGTCKIKSGDRNDSRLRTLFSEAVLSDQQLITHRNIVVIEWNEKNNQIPFFPEKSDVSHSAYK